MLSHQGARIGKALSIWHYSFGRMICRGLTKHVLIDSFASKPFSGNPAAVVFQQGRDSWMQNVASELNSPVTAFIKKSELHSSAYDILWFTPMKEIYICGHATLAAAHALYSMKNEGGEVPTDNMITFVSPYQGEISAIRAENGAIQFSFQAEAPVATTLTDTDLEHLTAALSIEQSDILYTGRTATDLVVELSRSSFARISQVVDYSRIAALGGRGLVITCLGKKRIPTGQKDSYHCVSCGGHTFMNDTSYDYLLRGFFPSMGLNEDSATGSAQCALAPYYFQKFGIAVNAEESDVTRLRSLTGYQASKRGGVMQIALVSGSDSMGDRVVIAGHCVTIMQSTLCIDPL